MALPNFSLEKLSLMMEYAQGLRAASPTPTDMRNRNSWPKERAKPQQTVARLHTARPAMMRCFRDTRSAKRPKGNPMRV